MENAYAPHSLDKSVVKQLSPDNGGVHGAWELTTSFPGTGKVPTEPSDSISKASTPV